jgi:alkane 1-monooxygenase
MGSKAWPYTLPLALYIAAWVSFTQTGMLAWLPAIIAFLFIPLAELIIPADSYNLSSEEEQLAKNNKTYDYLLYSAVVLQYVALYFFLTSMQDETLSSLDRSGRIVTMGLLCGIFGINVGHELGHRNNPSEQLLAKASLLSSLYLHFMTEHNKGHHKYVGTPKDPTSARYNENVYSFWFRSFFGTIASAWKIALEEQRRKGRSILQNEMLQFQLVHIIFSLTIGFIFGWLVLLYFVIAAFIGITLLSTVNYIEHYGLSRRSTGNNSFERAMPHHSWNSNHSFGRYILFELSRHSDHHYLASRKYQLLRHHEGSPELPTGYPGSMLLTLVPSLWFKVMNNKIKQMETDK